MTRMNFSKLQILYTINILNKVKAPANSVTIAEELDKPKPLIVSSLNNLAKFHYIRRIPDGHNSCCLRYALLKEGRSVLKKLKERAMRCRELFLYFDPIPRNYTEQEIAWLKKAFPKSCQESPHPALNNITQPTDQPEFLCAIVGEKTTRCLTSFCKLYRECQHKTPAYTAKMQALMMNKSGDDKQEQTPQCCLTYSSDVTPLPRGQPCSQVRGAP